MKVSDLILQGDVYASLDAIDNNSISIAITSPPYWKQRDYGFKGQIGQEESPEGFIGHLLTIFGKLREKLRENGIFFLNIGDKYQGQYGKSHLLMIPYRLAYHMVKNDWILEDIIIWYKPNHMPSSLKDRFTNTYEPVFVFAKNEDNVYKNNKSVLKVPLQQTKWKHTAVYPEKLIETLLDKVVLSDYDRILDPFAGTGTVAVVTKRKRNQLLGVKIYSTMIDKGADFIKIIKQRTGIKDVKIIDDVKYKWEPIKKKELPNVKPYNLFQDRHGEVYITENSNQFLSMLKGVTTDEFKEFYREDALFFYGVKNWDIEDFYFFSRIYDLGYVIRNIIVLADSETWYPIFMFALDNTRFAYKFYIDRIRVNAKTKEEKMNWVDYNFFGMLVRDVTRKKSEEGIIVRIFKRYSDGFPKFVEIRWSKSISTEYVMHPDNDCLIQESLNFKCPNCKVDLEDPFDLISENICPSCETELWQDVNSIPIINEPNTVLRSFNEIKKLNVSDGERCNIEQISAEKNNTNSKFKDLDRKNWGQSPGARKVMIGEYFTKMRLYRLDHPLVAQYLTILRKSKGLSVKDVTEEYPKSYKHTVGHWFRKDFGGSIPIPKDINKLQEILNIKDGLIRALSRTALKLQMVRQSKKGKNPGDFIKGMSHQKLEVYLKSLFLPSKRYKELIELSLE